MSSVAEMYPPRENVYIIIDNSFNVVPYQSIKEGENYIIQLLSGSFSIYCKTSLFDDTLIKKVKTHEEVINFFQNLK